MRAKTVGQGLAALEHAQHIEYDAAELGPLRQLAGDVQRAVERDACVEQCGKLLCEEKDVAMASAIEIGQVKLKRFLLFQTDIDRRQPLLAQFARNGLIALTRQITSAKLAVRRDRFEVEG